MSLRDRLGAAILSRFLPEEVPELGQVALPLDGGAGLRIDRRATPSIALLHRADEALSWVSHVSWSSDTSRFDHRLGEVVVLAQSGAVNDCLPHSIAAVQALDTWVAQDSFGSKAAWEHSSDVAWRVMRIALILSLAEKEVDPGLKMRLAGSARIHALSLRCALRRSSGVHPRRAVLQASALVVIGLVWPRLDGAREWWSEGLVGLGQNLEALLLADGSSGGVLSDHMESMEAAALAHTACMQAGIAFPATAEKALLRGVRFLQAMESAQALAAVSSFGPLDGAVVSQWMHRLLGGGSPDQLGWTLSAFREGGWIAARCVGKYEDTFLHWVLGERELTRSHPAWGAVDCAVLEGVAHCGGGEVESARVDGRRVQVSAVAIKGSLLQRRKVVAEGSRLVVEDRVEGDQAVEVEWVWRLAPGWSVSSETDFTHAVRSGRRLRVGLSKALEWAVERTDTGVIFRARGMLLPGNRVLNRFELEKG